MALVNFKKGLLASLPSTYAEGTFYITTDERAIYLDVANDKRIRLGDFQEFADLAALKANENPSTTALYYIKDGNILAKYDSEKGTYVQINVQKTLEELGGVSKTTFDALAGKVNALEVTGGQANVIETVKVNGVALPVTEKAVDVTVPTGALASKDSVSKDELADSLKSEIEGKLNASAVTGDLLTHNAADFAAALHNHAISEVTGLQDALDGKQAVGDYATKTEAQGYANAKDEAIAAAKKAGDDAQDAVDALTAKVGEVPTDKTVVGMIADAQAAATYDDTEVRGLITAEETRAKGVEAGLRTDVDAIKADYLKAADIADFETKENVKKVSDDLAAYVESNNTALAGVKATAEAAAVKTEVETALAGKADKLVVDAMYTNAKIDELIQGAKDYADNNDADTKYGIVYDSENKKIKLVEGGSEVEIDASAFIKDGMISNVTIGEDDDLVITFNTDAGKENIVLPLDQLVDIYTGVTDDRVKVTVNADKSISADLVAGAIGKDYLDSGVNASLALADSALQAADLTDLNNAKHTHANKELLDTYTQTEANLADAVAKKHEHTNKAVLDGITAEKVTAWDAAEQNAKDYANTEVAKDRVRLDALEAIDHDAYVAADAALKTELQGKIDTKANSADVYTKAETFTKDEVNTAIATALTWGEF